MNTSFASVVQSPKQGYQWPQGRRCRKTLYLDHVHFLPCISGYSLLLRDWCKENVIFMLIRWHHNVILHSDEPSRSVLHSLSEMINDNSKYKRNDFGITIIVIIGKWNHWSRNMGQSSILLSRNCHVAEICSNGDSQLEHDLLNTSVAFL